MRLTSFNAGLVQTQLIDGVEVRTAYVKTAVPEPWVITPTGAQGDQVAVHTDHLYAFDRESYDFWAAELGADRDTWGDGHFAENLTLDTLDQSSLRVGDTFRLGDAVIVVTGPRVPCWKLTWRLGQPKPFMKRFRLSGRSGSYFGVIEPGVVRPGDELTLLSSDPEAPTVAELSRLCETSTLVSAADRAVIGRALAHPQLSRTVRDTLVLKVAGLDAASTPGTWTGWRRFEVECRVAETADATSFHLRPVDGGELPAFRAGQHVVVRLTEPGAEPGTEPGADPAGPVVRTWSLSSWDRDPQSYRITVKMLPGGRGGGALTRGAEGLAIDLRSPAGRFHLDRGSFRPVVLVAAGIGITPMVAMIRSHLERDVYRPPLWLLYATPDRERAAFLDELEPLFAQHDDLHLRLVHSRTDGRLTAERVVEVMQGNYLRTPDGPASIPWFESDIYLCGPADFNDTIRDGLVAAGANPDLVFVEEFAAGTGEVITPTRQADAAVAFAIDGTETETTWVAGDEQTLLELAEDAGLDPPYDCRAGTCRTCESRLLCGDVDGSVTTAADGSRRVLLCISYPRSDRVVVEPPV